MTAPVDSTSALSARARLFSEIDDELGFLEAKSLRRHLAVVESVNGPLVRIAGRELVSWCSNDYLGLSANPRLTKAAARTAGIWGVGARASRLLAGTMRIHRQLEDALASWYGAESAIVFASGYLTNLGTLGCLLSEDDIVFVDRLAHASLIDASRAARAKLRVFRHNDIGQLAHLLDRAGGVRRRIIVTEGLFSMDGDRAPLADLAEVAEAHGALVYLDDAHGAFVLGDSGRGSPEEAGLTHERFIYVGTLGKALGCQGGFVIGPRQLIEFLRNRARTFVYVTALAIPVAAAALEALRVLEEQPVHLERLRENVALLSGRLSSEGICPRPISSHIMPIIIGDSSRAIQLSQGLMERGCWVPAIRPPSVPQGTARLRISVSALHTEAHIERLVQALKEMKDD